MYPEVEMPSLQYVMSDGPVWVYIFHMMKNLTLTKNFFEKLLTEHLVVPRQIYIWKSTKYSQNFGNPS